MSQTLKASSTRDNAQMIERARKRLSKRAKRGFRGYPLATVALYGPDDRTATKLAIREGPGQIRVTAVVVFSPLQQQVGIGVASRADDVVHPSAILVPPIPVEGVMGDGGHRTQPRECAPEPVTSAQMCRMQSPRLATVEALGQVMRVPEVEIADLRALDTDYTEEVSRPHLECPGIPGRHRELGNFRQLSARPVVKRGVERWQLLDRIRQHRRCPASLGRVRGWHRMCRLCHGLSSSKVGSDAARILRQLARLSAFRGISDSL